MIIFLAINSIFSLKILELDKNEDESLVLLSAPYRAFIPIVHKAQLSGYFVSPDGSDTNPGSFLLPWRTIGKVAMEVEAGDMVYIRGGTYHESVTFTASGTLSNPITIAAYPGEYPVVDGEYSIPGYWGTLLFIMGDYNILSGIEVRNSAYMGVIVYGNYDIASNMYVHHCKENGILITHGQHSTVESSRVWRNVLSNEYGVGNGWSSGLSAARNGVSYAIIRHNTVWENWGEGISSYEADHITLEDNISHDNFSANVYISDSTNIIFTRNFVFMNPNSYIYGYGDNVGIMMGDETYNPPSANILIINNISVGNHNNFWWWQGLLGGGMDNVLIANNTFVNSSKGSGLTISGGTHQNVRFENNLVRQDGDLPIIATGYLNGITYSHNLWSKPPYPAASGPGDIVGDPLLVEFGSPFTPDWFRLMNISPAIGQALSLPEVFLDYFSSWRDSTPDIGAVEFIP